MISIVAGMTRPGSAAAASRNALKIATLLTLAIIVGGCAASKAFDSGTEAARANEWDLAVQQYRKALQLEPENVRYKIALTRAMVSASTHYAEQGRLAEARGQLDVALNAYRKANEFDPSNRQIAAKVSGLEKQIRDLSESARAKPNIEQLRENSRQVGPPALVGLNEVLPAFQYINQPVRLILETIANAAGINVTFERTFQDPARPYTIQMDGATLEQALSTVMSANQLFYKVVSPNTIMVIPEGQQNRLFYEDQVIKVLHLSNADATEVIGIVQNVVRMPGTPQTTFQVSANKTQNTITLRAPTNIAAIIERVVQLTDKPRAEVVVDVEILEVNRRRVKQYGLDLGDYAIGAVFSPDVNPIGSGSLSPQPFNLGNVVNNGISASDFYLAVPAATIRFLESDSETKLLAKPQLRGAEGEKLRLELGDDIPIPTTVFTPLASGGANVNPLSSFTYRTVGVVLEMTPRVTYDDNIILELTVENSARTGDTTIAGTTAPTFATRRVTAKLRLRDGESNLLAGLVQEADRRTLRGIPGILRLPVFKQLFSSNDSSTEQADVIVLLTPRIVRTHEITQRDIDPLFIGTPLNLGIGGGPSLLVQPLAQAAAAGAVPPAAAGAGPAAPAANPAAAATPPAAGGAGVGTPPVPPAAAAPGQAPATATPAAAAPGAAAPGLPPTPRDQATPPVTGTPTPTAVPTGGQIMLAPQSLDVRVGNGALAVPIVVTDVSRLSSATLTITYNPAVLRVNAVQQGNFISRPGGPVAFTEDHAKPGRIDVVLLRTGDSTGVSGSGSLAYVLFDAIATGPSNLTITGTTTAPGGAPLPVQFGSPPNVTVK